MKKTFWIEELTVIPMTRHEEEGIRMFETYD
jgi:hypothetical protein